MMGLLAGIWPKIVGVLAIIGAALGVVWKNRSDAVKLDRAKEKEKDHARADAIRDRVSNERADAVRKYDDAGYRD